MENIQTFAEKIFRLDVFGFRDAETEPGAAVQDIENELKSQTGCIDIIKFLLEYIEEAEA